MLKQNACLHTAENLHQLNCEMLKHPLYNHNLAPSNYHSKDALKSHHFASDQDVKEVPVWLLAQPRILVDH
jgi:hypothetical protein